MSKENKTIDRGLIKKILEADCEDPLASTDQLISQEIPPGVDRRSFLIRSAVGGAAAVMMGLCLGPGENSEGPRNTAVRRLPTKAAARSRPECREEGPGAGADDRGRVLQGGAGTFELAHDRPDAHHLRFLPASQPNCPPTNSPRRLSFRSTCSAVSARPARDTARSAPRWPDWLEKSRQPWTRNFSTACETSLTRRSR